MKVALTPAWELSDEHPRSSLGQPVLVDRSRGLAYRPDDVLQAYPSWGVLPAARVVQRLANAADLTGDARALVARFVGFLVAGYHTTPSTPHSGRAPGTQLELNQSIADVTRVIDPTAPQKASRRPTAAEQATPPAR